MRVELLVAVFIAAITPLTALAQVQFQPGAGGAGDGGTHTSVMKVHRLSPIHDLAATCDGGVSETLVTRYFVLTAADGQDRQTARSNEVSVADCPQDGRAALTWSSVHGATSYVIYAGAAAGQTTLVNPVTLNGLPLASNQWVYLSTGDNHPNLDDDFFGPIDPPAENLAHASEYLFDGTGWDLGPNVQGFNASFFGDATLGAAGKTANVAGYWFHDIGTIGPTQAADCFVDGSGTKFGGWSLVDSYTLRAVPCAGAPASGMSKVQVESLSVGTSTTLRTWTAGGGAPSSNCRVGDYYSRADGAANTALYVCTASNTWSAVLNTAPAASFNEYVYRKAAYCWGNGACGQTSEWDWNGLDSGLPSFSAGAGGNDHKASADFSDGMTRDMQTSFVLPASWNSGAATTLDFYWFSGVGDAGKSAVWQAQTVCSSPGDALNTAFNAFDTVASAADAAASKLRVAAISALTMSGCAAGDTLTINIKRDPAHASDNLGATAQLLAIRLGYQR